MYLEVDVWNGFAGLRERETKQELFLRYEELDDVDGTAQALQRAIEEAVQAAQNPSFHMGIPMHCLIPLHMHTILIINIIMVGIA